MRAAELESQRAKPRAILLDHNKLSLTLNAFSQEWHSLAAQKASSMQIFEAV